MPVDAAKDDFFGVDAQPRNFGNERFAVLFVDDEPRILSGLRNLMRRYRSTVDSYFANGGDEAIEYLSRREFDILVTDVRMPKIDGLALLAHAREQCPATARIILSGHASQEAQLMCSTVAHQFLMKPCAPPELLATFRRIFWAQGLIPDRGLRATLGKFSVFPLSPTTVHLIGDHQVGKTPGTDMLECACLSDVTLLARTLRIAGVDRFNARSPFESIKSAISSLGAEPAARIIESIEDPEHLELQDNHLWFRWIDETRHAFDVAVQVQKHLEKTAPELAEEGALAGLLHDFGRLALLAIYPTAMLALNDQRVGHNSAMVVEERRRMGHDHAEIAAYLLALWGYPARTIVPILAHHGDHQTNLDSALIAPFAPVIEALQQIEAVGNRALATIIESKEAQGEVDVAANFRSIEQLSTEVCQAIRDDDQAKKIASSALKRRIA